MLRNRFTRFSFLLLLSAFTTVAIAGPPPGKGGGKNRASLSVTVTPDSFIESDAGATPAATGTVTRENSDLVGDLTVTLESSNINEATVPDSVVILDGQASIEFDVFAVNDAVKDGDQSVTISVSATDHSGATTSVTVIDVESLPQIAYVPTVIPMPSDVGWVTVNDINYHGVVAGYTTTAVGEALIKHAFIYDPNADTPFIDLQEDLEFPGFDYENWVIASVVGINNNGLAVGYAELVSDPTVRQGFAIDLDAIEIYGLPETDQGWPFSYARKVNDNGDILGGYRRADDESTGGFYLVNLGLRGIENAYPLETTNDTVNYPSASLTEPTEEKAVQVVTELRSGDLMVYTQGESDVRTIAANFVESDANIDGDIAAISRTQEVVPLKGKKTETITTEELFLEIDGIQSYVPLPDRNSVPSLKLNSSGTVLWITEEMTLYTSEFGFLDINTLSTSVVPSRTGSITNVHMNDFGWDGFTEIAYGRTDPDTLEASLIILTPVPLP